MNPRSITMLAACTALVLALPVQAETRRVAIVVGNNAGDASEKPLHYAEEDALKIADVLTQLGDVHEGNLFLLKGGGKRALQEVIAQATGLLAKVRENPADRSILIFYYSGHSDGEALELGSDRVSYAELRASLAATRADVRVVVVDGCKSGALSQSKGGERAAPFEIRLSDQLDATGEVVLTSSAADELALESREIRGSFFTHHLVSGLRGAADTSGDGRVTLAEAYQYAFDHTLSATASTGLRQHPGYDYRLAGKGELVLTEVTHPSASLELPEGFERALIVLVRRDQVLAELTSDAARRLALSPGEYAVRVWKGTQAYAARVNVVAGEVRRVAWSELGRVPSAQVASKGPTDTPAVEGLESLNPEARVEFERKYLLIGDQVELWVSRHFATLSPTYVVYEGKYRREVPENDFFRQVGRSDLAQSYERRRALSVGLIVGSAALFVGSAIYAFTNIRTPTPCNLPVTDPAFADKCVYHADQGNFSSVWIGVGGVGIASLMALGGIASYRARHPVEADEMRRLADEYNVALIRKLGGAPPQRREASRPVITLDLTPTASPHGAGLALQATF